MIKTTVRTRTARASGKNGFLRRARKSAILCKPRLRVLLLVQLNSGFANMASTKHKQAEQSRKVNPVSTKSSSFVVLRRIQSVSNWLYSVLPQKAPRLDVSSNHLNQHGATLDTADWECIDFTLCKETILHPINNRENKFFTMAKFARKRSDLLTCCVYETAAVAVEPHQQNEHCPWVVATENWRTAPTPT